MGAEGHDEIAAPSPETVSKIGRLALKLASETVETWRNAATTEFPDHQDNLDTRSALAATLGTAAILIANDTLVRLDDSPANRLVALEELIDASLPQLLMGRTIAFMSESLAKRDADAAQEKPIAG